MQQVEQRAIQTFKNNLEFLEKNHKLVYEKIALLNTLIEDGIYQEHYALEYKDEGYFDIIELLSGEYLYKENSVKHALRMKMNFDLKRVGAVFKGQKFSRATDEQADVIDKSDLSFHNALWATIKIINYVGAVATPESFMNRVHKIIFLGVGLGIHLKDIIERLNPQVIFIKEKNLETFRLSLFVTNYEDILKSRFVFFSLADDELQERENFLEFLNRGNNYNLYLKHIPFALDYQSEVQRLQSHVLSQSYINYGYSAMLLRFIDSPRYLARGYSFLNVTKRYNDNIFSDKPVLLLFSGPSTSKNIDWIIANRNRFVVISPLSVCRLLQYNNITPDIIVHIDPGEASSTLFEGIEPDYFKHSEILLASNVNEETLSHFEKSQVHFIEQGTYYKKGFGRLSAPSVGEYCYALFMILGTHNMFLLGIDLALDKETFKSHGSFHPGEHIEGKKDSESASLDPTASISYVKGNLSEQVPTLSSYKISLEQIEIFSNDYKRDYNNIYNLSDGAYLDGCTPLHFNDFDWENFTTLNRTEVKEEISKFFNSIGSSDFNDDDKGQIRYQIKEAKKLEKIIKQHQKKKFANIEAYLNSLAQLSWDLGDMQYKTNSDLAQVYYEYFSIILSYIFDLFNTKELSNPDKHVTKINAILVRQLLKMSHLYIMKLEGYLK